MKAFSRIAVLGILCCACMAAADLNTPVPPPLEPWIEWVLEDTPAVRCPFLYDNAAMRQCIWGSVLTLSVSETGAAFSQTWKTYADAWVVLPGDKGHWPMKVTANGRSAPVVSRSAKPAVFLEKGIHTIKGSFSWTKRPESLDIPAAVGLVSLTLDGSSISRPNRDSAGKLWFGRSERSAEREEMVTDEIDLKVYRKITEGVPLIIETVVDMRVSGSDREMLLGRMLLAGSIPLKLENSLPARLEKDGNLRVQVRSGRWRVELRSRLRDVPDTLVSKVQTQKWPAEEIWVYQSDNNLRTTTVKGVPSINPSETELPSKWRALPAFLVTPETPFILEEKHRGDWSPTPNQLSVNRVFWLGFAGKEFTVKDRIRGTMNQGWRLNAAPGCRLGSVKLDGQPQLITRIGDELPGVEVRHGVVKLTALSRCPATKAISATGWAHDVTQLAATINLPPGWDLLHVLGADRVPGSWFGEWTLWDIFLLLLLSVAAARLLNKKWAAVLFATLALTMHETGAPLYTWLNLIIVTALLKVLPKGAFRRVIEAARVIVLVLLVFYSITLSINLIRQAIYPQLEAYSATSRTAGSLSRSAEEVVLMDEAEKEMSKKARPQYQRKSRAGISSRSAPRKRYDASSKIQTGPGEPRWSWKSYRLIWSGPVSKDQDISILLIPPIVRRILNLIEVGLLFMLIFGFLFPAPLKKSNFAKMKSFFTSAASLILLCLFAQPGGARAAIPDSAMLAELQRRLLEPGVCEEQCAHLVEGNIAINGDMLRITLVVDALEKTAWPLPGGRGGWLPSSVRLNGTLLREIARIRNRLYCTVPQGRATLILTGSVDGKSTQVPFAFDAPNMTVSATGWKVSGLKSGSVVGGAVHLEKREKTVARQRRSRSLLPDPVTPFVRVKRALSFDYDWFVNTTVTREAPHTGAINLLLPLLEGESVITPNIVDEKGRAKVILAAGERSISWESKLRVGDSLVLVAGTSDSYVEEWTIDASAKWHVTTQGLTRIKSGADGRYQYPRWIPRKGERLVVRAFKPKAVPGATRTVESASLEYAPGKRMAETTLSLRVNSSQGDKAAMTIPAGAVLDKVSINGVEQAIAHQEGRLSIPLRPHTQEVEIVWKEQVGTRPITATPAVRLDTEVSNVNLLMRLPRNRWPLFFGGPLMGPAMIFWGVLIVLILVSVGLGYAGITPIRGYQWALLFFGMSTFNSFGGFLVVVWALAMAKRATLVDGVRRRWFNGMQVGLVVLTVAALATLAVTVPFGLLSTPNMQVTGNGSSSYLYQWYQDRCDGAFPTGWVLSVPLWVYRLVMLLWSVWLAIWLPKWVKWGWKAFSTGGLWCRNARSAPRTRTQDPDQPTPDDETGA